MIDYYRSGQLLDNASYIVVFLGAVFVQDAKSPTEPDKVRAIKHTGSKPPLKANYSYMGGTFDARYDGNGLFSIGSVDFLAKKYRWTFSTGSILATGDLVAMLGGVFRAECDSSEAVLTRIPEGKLPKGISSPQWDSITLPFPGHVSFSTDPLVILKVLQFDAKNDGDLSVLLRITEGIQKKPKSLGMPTAFQAKVKAGDIVLLNGKGHQLRSIVPPNPDTRIVGWLELSPHPIPEADLIRDKKAFVRPEREMAK